MDDEAASIRLLMYRCERSGVAARNQRDVGCSQLDHVNGGKVQSKVCSAEE